MKHRWQKKILLGIILLGGAMTLSSCNFLSEEEGLVIQNISTRTLEDGDIEMTISYTDESHPHTVVIIPKGDQGENGNGIQAISYTQDEKGNTTIQITYTSPDRAPVTFTLPGAKSILGVSSHFDEEGNTVLVVAYSDGSFSDPIVVQKGEQGDKGTDGKSIERITSRVDTNTGSTYVSFYREGEQNPIATVEIPSGKNGVGIANILTATDSSGNTVVTISYTDGRENTVFTLNRANQWISGTGVPNVNLGYDGDFYFDTENKAIYLKRNGSWGSPIINFSDLTEEEFTITLDLNDSKEAPASLANPDVVYRIKRGQNFLSSGYHTLPQPTRNGYRFDGWYTDSVVTPVSGKFTNLTAVFSDITLYAIWDNL